MCGEKQKGKTDNLAIRLSWNFCVEHEPGDGFPIERCKSATLVPNEISEIVFRYCPADGKIHAYEIKENDLGTML